MKNKSFDQPKQHDRKMDTEDLTTKTYKAIMLEAEKFNHDLTLHFGLLSYQCEDEKQFIKKSEMLIDEMLQYDKNNRDDMFFGKPPKKKEFHIALQKIKENIKKLQPNV